MTLEIRNRACKTPVNRLFSRPQIYFLKMDEPKKKNRHVEVENIHRNIHHS
jgi:hypothetical protein